MPLALDVDLAAAPLARGIHRAANYFVMDWRPLRATSSAVLLIAGALLWRYFTRGGADSPCCG